MHDPATVTAFLFTDIEGSTRLPAKLLAPLLQAKAVATVPKPSIWSSTSSWATAMRDEYGASR